MYFSRENVSHCAFGNIDVEDFKYQIMDELYGIDEEKFLSYEEERTVDILIDELVALNKMVYSKEIKLSQYQKNAIGEYKGAGFRKYNAFMRGNFEVLNEEYIPKKSIKQLVRDLLQMEALANALPGRRKGAGVKMMLDYMKDADKLDRVRLGKCDGLDVSRLSLPISKKMVKVAYQSYEYLFDMLEILEKNEVMNNLDEINETLQEVRQIKEKKLEEEIKIEELKYFDDEIEKESTNQDVIMSKIVEESKEKVKLSKIRKIK